MEQLFATTLNSLCIFDDNIKNGIVILEHVVFGIGVPLNLLGLWCIFRDKSTRIKWILFNCQIWYFFCDIMISLLAVPQLFIPFAAYYSLGLFTSLGIPMYIQLPIAATSFGGMGAATIHLFFHRHQTILSRQHPRAMRSLFRYIFLVLLYSYFCSVGLFIHLILAKDKTRSLIEYSLEYECLYRELYLPETVLLDSNYFLLLVIYAIIYVAIWIFSIFFLILDSFHALNTEQRTLSIQTRAQIRRSLKNIVLQISISMTFLVIPVVVIICQVIFKKYNQLITSIGLGFLSFHSSMGTIAGICLNKQYRQNLLNATRLQIYGGTVSNKITAITRSQAT